MTRGVALLICGLLVVTSCGTHPLAAQSGQPAILVFADTENSAGITSEISAAVSSLLGVNQVRLSEDALTDSDLLIIHRRQLLDRDLGESVDRFRLVKQNNDCFLVQESTLKSVQLEGVSCKPLE